MNEIPDWISLSSWINGETGGYLRVCTEGRNWFETDFPNWLSQDPPQFTPGKRSEEHGSYIIESLARRAASTGATSTSSTGATSRTCPTAASSRFPAMWTATGINMPVVGDLPLACAATCSASGPRSADGHGSRRAGAM